jgi:DNA-binding beta-propeller fold protein YncE
MDDMIRSRHHAGLTRRELLRNLGGGALTLAAGNLLGGCGGGSSSTFGPAIAGRSLYVSTFTNNTIERYNFLTGAHLGTIYTDLGPAGMALGANNELFVALRFNNSIDRFDLATGSRTLRIKQVSAPHSVSIGPDGNVYCPNVPSYYSYPDSTDAIEHFDSATGAHLGTFAKMAMPFSLVWGPDQNLYASTALELGNTHPNSDSIRKFNGQTGADLGLLVNDDKIPFDMLFTNRGTVLVSEFLDNRVQEYDATTGASIGTFARVYFPIGITYGPDGNVYAASYSNALSGKNTGSVVVLDPTTGDLLATFVSGLAFAAFIVIA